MSTYLPSDSSPENIADFRFWRTSVVWGCEHVLDMELSVLVEVLLLLGPIILVELLDSLQFLIEYTPGVRFLILAILDFQPLPSSQKVHIPLVGARAVLQDDQDIR